MCAWVERVAVVVLALGVAGALPAAGKRYGLGTPATAEQIAGWDIDIRPDGVGLPPGEGTAEQGEAVYVKQCATCHGEFGEAIGRFPVLMGGRGTLTSEDPVKTVGSYWPYASTVFDYVRRAMPFGHAQSLTDDEVYGITAFVLNLNEIVEYDEVMNARTLAAVQMPNRDGFIKDDRPDVPAGEPCMSACRGEVKVTGKARIIDVTPEGEGGESSRAARSSAGDAGGDPSRGKTVFAACGACHSLNDGEHRVGPSLHGVIGRKAGSAQGFERYSTAMKASGMTWDEESLSRYIASPQSFVAGTNMPFPGLPDASDVRDVVAYLRESAVR